jgi:FlaA1/EpsC-like NDP-sugar epimerase
MTSYANKIDRIVSSDRSPALFATFLHEQTVFVTGGSAGLGREIAKAVAGQGK